MIQILIGVYIIWKKKDTSIRTMLRSKGSPIGSLLNDSPFDCLFLFFEIDKDPFDRLFLTFENGEVLVDHVDDGLPVDGQLWGTGEQPDH